MKQAPSDVPSAQGLRVVLLYADFNPQVVLGLLDGALSALRDMGAREIRQERSRARSSCPSRPRRPRSAGFDAVVALGAVIRGETDHYEHIAREAASGLSAVALETGVPVGFGVLTVASEAQALARSAPGPENKGAEAARAAVGMVHVLKRLRETDATDAATSATDTATSATKAQRTQRALGHATVRGLPKKTRRRP